MKRWILAALAGGVTCAAVGRADSIWERRDPRYANLFQDNRARNIGDLVTVLITENTVANDQDQRAQNRTWSNSGQVQFFGATTVTGGGTGGNTAAPVPGVALGFPSVNSTRTLTGNSNLTTSQVFTDRMALTVVDIMPNDNLVVEGFRSRVVEGEERVLRITGVIRPADIGVGNVVLSQAIANFRISYLGRGPATRATQGVVGRVANIVAPK